MRKKTVWLFLVGACLMMALVTGAQAEYVPFEVELTLFERIVTLSLLPQKGNFTTLKIVQELQMELAPSEEEFAKAGLVSTSEGSVNAQDWNAVEPKIIVMGDAAKGIITKALVKLNDNEDLSIQQYSLYKKFVLEMQKEE